MRAWHFQDAMILFLGLSNREAENEILFLSSVDIQRSRYTRLSEDVFFFSPSRSCLNAIARMCIILIVATCD